MTKILLALLLPLFLSCASTGTERTLAMIKPDGLLNNHTEAIKNMILKSGFSVVAEIQFQFTKDNATVFYAEHSGKGFFPRLVDYITSGPVFVMVLEKPNAVSDLRYLIGPTDAEKAKLTHPDSIRAFCGLNVERNCIHGSDSTQSAAREISFFFNKKLFGEVARHDEL